MRYESLPSFVHEMAESLGRAIDAKDRYTKNHSDEVAVLAYALALELGMTPQQADVIHIAGHLHDVGKIGVPDAVLGKQEALSPAEWELMRRHPALGAAILSPVEILSSMGVPDLVLCHHERFDGRGYPGGLRGETIPPGARIIAVADSVSAMLQQRPYRQARSFESACRELRQGASSQFDPRVVNGFLRSRDTFHALIRSMRASVGASPLEDAPITSCAVAAKN